MEVNKELIGKVSKWFEDKGLDKEPPLAQYTKVLEEHAELGVNMVKKNMVEIIDAFGDEQVTLVGMAIQMEIDPLELYTIPPYIYVNTSNSVKEANNLDLYAFISSHIGNIGLSCCSNLYKKYDKESFLHNVWSAISLLEVLAARFDLGLMECLQVAYDVIKDRKGKMVNGIWVKEEDLVNECEHKETEEYNHYRDDMRRLVEYEERCTHCGDVRYFNYGSFTVWGKPTTKDDLPF